MEKWKLYDENEKLVIEEFDSSNKHPDNLYHKASDIWIMNSENKILIQKRSPNKKYEPDVWAMTGGSLIENETPQETIKREVKEELGLNINTNNIKLLNHCKTGLVIVDEYFIRQDVNINDVIIQKSELTQVKWATIEEIDNLVKTNQFIKERWQYVRDKIYAEIKK